MMEAIRGAGSDFPKDADYQQWRARQYFIERLDVSSPQGLMNHLRTVVYPRYRRAREEGHLLLSAWIWSSPGSIDRGPAPNVVSEFLAAVEDWALRFRVAEGFVYEAVLQSMDRWFEGADQHLTYGESLGMLAGATVATVASSMEWLPGYDSSSTARRKYLERCAHDFDAHVAELEGAGIRYDPQIISWFASSQVYEETAQFIAECNPHITAIEVRRKLHKAARLLGWQGLRFRAVVGRPKRAAS